jgi:hypothetical protein
MQLYATFEADEDVGRLDVEMNNTVLCLSVIHNLPGPSRPRR